MKRYIISIVIILAYQLAFGQQIAKSTYSKTLLKNATVHTITDGIKENTDVLIDDGKIIEVGTNLSATDAAVINCSDHHIYPGFVNSGTQLGMSEVGAVSLTNDFNEIGDFIPHMKALTAVNPNAVAIPVTRVNGVTSVIAAPRGGLFPGTASLINLHGYTPNDMYAGFKGVAMNFPSSAKRGRRDRRSDEDIKKAQEKAMKNLNDIWANLSTYAKIDSAKGTQSTSAPKTYQPEYDALIDVYRGNTALMIEVNKDQDIKNAIEWVSDKDLNVIFTGVTEGWRVAEELAASGIPVITGPVLSIPGRSYVRYDSNYRNAGIMQQAGVTVALRTDDAENARNLPFNAGFAATYGMGVEEALKSITINPAKIFGLEDQYGSITAGKVANLFVSTGDPFEMKTDITHLFINGWNVPIESRHTLLYNEFLHRSPGK
jgi:imidazolonepropionase-like amidohydrolase